MIIKTSILMMFMIKQKNTSKEDELFDYVDIPSYLKTSKKSHNEIDKDDFEIGL